MPTQINAWLDRHFPLPKSFRVGTPSNTPNAHWLVWLVIEKQMHLHEIRDADWISLSENTDRTRTYVTKAIKILGIDQVTEVGDKRMVIDQLGEPPAQSLPIYMLTTRKDLNESVVYIGKTTASNRFAGGHSAALKLHDPKYQNYEKMVYRCSITMPLGDDHVALEWVDPVSVAEQILDDVESHLIYHFQPPLNTQKKKKNLATHQISIHIQNLAEGLRHDSFLNDYII
jgi:hypothetical protein